jgi:hypothetical protein
MSASRADDRKPATRCVTVLTPLIRHVNMGTLAFVMFIALALLSARHGKDSETRESAPLRATKTEVVIDNLDFRDMDTPGPVAPN